MKGEARKLLPTIDMSGNRSVIDDKYNTDEQVDLKKLKEEALKQNNDGEE